MQLGSIRGDLKRRRAKVRREMRLKILKRLSLILNN